MGECVRTIEIELPTVVDLSSAVTPRAVQHALEELHALSVKSGQLAEHFSYLFAAGDAYGDILRQRLAGLRESATPSGSTRTHCIGSRVGPGLATCAALEKRLAVLSGKLERAIGPLDVRIVPASADGRRAVDDRHQY